MEARMIHPIYRVTGFDVVKPYTLWVSFDDETEQTIDFQPVLAGELYRPLRDLALFNQARIDPEVHTLVWPNGADFDPATLHDWPMYVEALIARAKQWELQPA
jgi:hypothetical protein